MVATVLETHFPNLNLMSRGKVRDIYDLDDPDLGRRGDLDNPNPLGDRLLIVASDRISAFDYVLPSAIPQKGHVLTALSEFWFGHTKHIVRNHLISTRVADFPLVAQEHAETLEGRSMLVHRAERVDVECVVRGYLSGSAWREYRQSGTVCGAKLPLGLRESDKLPDPLFTPATKAASGHDENIAVERMAELVGADVTESLKTASVALYRVAADYALSRGIIIADTKFEFGYVDGAPMLIDEALTPDSSRFWPLDGYEPGRSQASFDKQYVRDYLESLNWDKQPPVPPLSDEVVRGTSRRYLEAYERIVGRPLL
ncbi:phosphoribosylaminoimidazolesuccinocarboxamide synthase [Candidatus Jorgensenbacteria bacterium RIFCSPLOWO2_01_FULL_45_25b]|uniref:Phosphoribosylaminoimidazole-succinocarboxamide synthase n=1 Tax=Candidatus Jorgensenbacteria bacterium RIFCSPLOWO2_01_FULL_45_25b TaxID=1798471 RepID=A0A1F6BYW5_9BACT|nr:MAG: phosphoribosylaminoimidazolesuccinocarboxamide synthase [Candidatus Jorgensenbacteria bacterium RIFCSPLOWO2_01_FULL_45_25b]